MRWCEKHAAKICDSSVAFLRGCRCTSSVCWSMGKRTVKEVFPNLSLLCMAGWRLDLTKRAFGNFWGLTLRGWNCTQRPSAYQDAPEVEECCST